MQLCLLVMGPLEDKLLAPLIDTYLARISHYVNIEIEVIPNITSAAARKDIQLLKRLEGDQILRRLKSTDAVTLLDERGKEPTSRALAEMLQQKMLSGCKRWVLVVGGAYGFDTEVYTAVPSRLSLSKLTFTHNMIRLLAVEQLYRAFTILNNQPYHHD